MRCSWFKAWHAVLPSRLHGAGKLLCQTCLKMLISVRISLCDTLKVTQLKRFGLIECLDTHTVADIFDFVSKGILSSGDNFVLPAQYAGLPVHAEVGSDMTGSFQNVPLHIQVKDVIIFGKYLQFLLSSENDSVTRSQKGPV